MVLRLHLAECIGAHLLALESMVLRLALHAHLLTLETTVLRLALHAHLLALKGAIAGLTELLALEPAVARLALHAELLLRALDREPLCAAATVLARHRETLHLRGREAAPVAATTAAEALKARAPSAAVTASAAERLEVRITAAVSTAAAPATVLLLRRRSAATVRIAATSAGLRCGRACNRQSGDARGEEQPGHGISPFERGKTARKPHRSNT
jgi:hypothetical protein